MKTASPLRRFRYAFDNYMSKGTIALIGGLALLSFVLILVAGVVLVVTGVTQEDGAQLGFAEAMWASLMRTLDAGTMGGDTGTGFRFIMLGVTFGGIFIVSALIGVLNTGLEARIEMLRKGRSTVIESGHTVILGWSQHVFSIISELVIANANQKNPCIVILGDRDKVEMEDEVRDRAGDTGRTRIVCRSGSPLELDDLDMVSVQTARSIIVLSPAGPDPDSSVIKTILAVTNSPSRRAEPYHIVAEIADQKNVEVAKMVGRDEVELILAGDLISRIMVQTCRQSGLSVVYTELMDFGGDEIYFQAEPSLVGKTFGDALLAYEDSAVIGLCRGNGAVHLNPPMETRIEEGDRVIAVSEDDDTVRVSGRSSFDIDANAICTSGTVTPAPERTLILGWNQRTPDVINELDNYVAPGSEVLVVAGQADGAAQIASRCAALRNQRAEFRQGDTTDRRTLDGLDVARFDHAIILCYDNLDEQQADARTLITLLHLRDIAERSGRHRPIVSEMLDIRNRTLAEVTHADDFIVSDKLISLMLSQVSENKALNAVFASILDAEGSEIYIKPAANYVTPGTPVNFYTVVEAARRRGEVAFGYRIAAQAKDARKAYGVVINPAKSETIRFAPDDRIVVLAEN